jgi:hypothetical protein
MSLVFFRETVAIGSVYGIFGLIGLPVEIVYRETKEEHDCHRHRSASNTFNESGNIDHAAASDTDKEGSEHEEVDQIHALFPDEL